MGHLGILVPIVWTSSYHNLLITAVHPSCCSIKPKQTHTAVTSTTSTTAELLTTVLFSYYTTTAAAGDGGGGGMMSFIDFLSGSSNSQWWLTTMTSFTIGFPGIGVSEAINTRGRFRDLVSCKRETNPSRRREWCRRSKEDGQHLDVKIWTLEHQSDDHRWPFSLTRSYFIYPHKAGTL